MKSSLLRNYSQEVEEQGTVLKCGPTLKNMLKGNKSMICWNFWQNSRIRFIATQNRSNHVFIVGMTRVFSLQKVHMIRGHYPFKFQEAAA